MGNQDESACYLWILYKFISIGKVIVMEKNLSIGCTVDNCKYHSQTEDYCTLNKIQVGTHEAVPKMKECTDCNSFELKDSCTSCGCH